MGNKLFGTDGVRGVANQYPMTADFAQKLATAAGLLECRNHHRAAIARDTRISGEMLEAAVAAGFMSAGVEVIKLGVLPTPALTAITPELNVDMAVMITASHNPYHDNGIKLINADGNKFSDEETAKIETAVMAGKFELSPESIGRQTELPDAAALYLDKVFSLAGDEKQPLQGLRIVLDCANGAFYKIMPEVYKNLGAGIITLSHEPDGRNINQNCGSQHIENMQKTVREAHAHLGIACDGDGDRIIVCNEKGEKIASEQLIAFIAKTMKDRGTLNGRPVVSTIVSNTGLDSYVKSLGVDYYATKVGERYVIEKMQETGGAVGGEESGHIVLGDYSKTGDALMVGLFLSLALVKSKRKMSEIFPVFTPEPCEAINLRFADNETVRKIMQDETVNRAAETARKKIEGIGRVVFRASGTEPVVRIWVGGQKADIVKAAAAEIKNAVEKAAARNETTNQL